MIRCHRERVLRERLQGAAPVPELEVKAAGPVSFDLPAKPAESLEAKRLRVFAEELGRALAE
jgi:hypothetical protein